jgi:hypothetical protein
MEPQQDAYAMHYGCGDDEVDALKALVFRLEEIEKQLARAGAAEAREALKIYGRHWSDCDVARLNDMDVACDCGLDAVLAEKDG